MGPRYVRTGARTTDRGPLMRQLRRTLVVLLTSVALVAALAAPALGHAHTVTNREPVFGGVTHETFSVRVGKGDLVRGNIIRFRQEHSYLRLGSALARGHVAGLENTRELARREQSKGALAGVNGGFFLSRSFLPGGAPNGAPNGFTAQDGLLVGGRTQVNNTGGAFARGVVGVRPSGALIMEWMERTTFELQRSDGTWEDVTRFSEVNVQPRIAGENPATHELLFYDQALGTSIQVPAGSKVFVVDDLRLGPLGEMGGVVTSVETVSSARTYPVRNGGTVVVARGSVPLGWVSSFSPGDPFTVRVTPQPERMSPSIWGDIVSSVPGGPLLIRNGSRTSSRMWNDEKFSDSFIWSRHPRTAVGRTNLGDVLLVTVDGRNSGWSAGMSIPELQSFMDGLGAVDALNLDGGGSTTMTVGSSIVNRPSEGSRSVANGLFVYHSYPFDGSRRISGADRFATAANVATRTYPNGVDQVVIATGAGFPDALAGGPLATKLGAPLLLTQRGELPQATLNALDTLRPDFAVLLGGTAAIGDAVRDALRDRGISVSRVSGDDRFGTATAIGRTIVGREDVERVFVATGAGFADALSAAAPAGMLEAPILLTAKGELSDPARRFITERDVGEVVIVGGTAAVSNTVRDELRALDTSMTVRRISGEDRYQTAKDLNEWATGRVPAHDGTGLIVANGSGFADALAGGPHAAAGNHLLMIVPSRDVNANPHAEAYLDARGAGPLDRITLIGGRAVLTDYQRWQLDQVAIR